MATQGFQQVQKQTQSMVLAPQLRQSLKILQVPTLELRSVILEELEQNPTLEELSLEDISIDAQSEKKKEENPEHESDELASSEDNILDKLKEKSEASESLDFSDEFKSLERMGEDFEGYINEEAGEIPYSSEAAEKRQHFFDSLTREASLQENLMEQARMVEESPSTLKAIEFLIGSLDERGFISGKITDLALMSNLPLRDLQNGAKILKSLEPTGIGAENIQECLLIQLQAKGLGNSLTAKIIEEKWKLLLRRRIPEIARSFNVNTSEVEDALKEISKLDPAPGKNFADDSNQIIEPDVTVEKDEYGEWVIILNNDYVPRLRISKDYKEILAKGLLKGKDREYLQEKFRSGKFIISAIEQRQQTIERITKELINYQKAFFEKGKAHLKPLTMNQVAETVGVHETTVSRAIANKYIRTPQGVFDMKFFFTPGYKNEDGKEVSNKSIKNRISKIIENESPGKPYSDQKIVEILKEEGVTIARRTVAKYREELGILPTNLRRQYA